MEPRTLHELVAAAASVHGERTAVTYDSGSGSPESLLYTDLYTLSCELCGIVQHYCFPNKGVIGLYCRDDLFLPVWLLGIIQAPAAYVPLDPAAPGLLSSRVIERCGLLYCAVQTGLLEQFQKSLSRFISAEVCVVLPKFKLTLVQVKSLQDTEQNKACEQTADGAALNKTSAEVKAALAYVLHTSGTTGHPKIVQVPHKCILPNILHLRSLFHFSKEDVVFLASPLTFDPSVVDIFLTLTSGAQLLIVPTIIKKMPNRLAQLLFISHKTTVLQVTPTLLCRFGHKILKEEVLSCGSSLRVLALGGEACPSPALLSTWKHKDNKTQIYNIYGITEVSCWACCYRIPESLLQSSNFMSSVPLGTPLMDTVVEARDEHGVVTEGEGQVFIGGADRVCLLDDEDTVVPGTMRATGDWVDIRDSQMYYMGRKDRLIKRHGKRINLDSLQQLILSVPLVEACTVGLYDNYRLLAFIVVSTAQGHKAASSLTFVHNHHIGQQQEDEGAEDGDVSRLILRQLSELLPSYSVPDTLVLVPDIPLTPHGKVDMKALMEIYQTQRTSLQCSSSQRDIMQLKGTLESLWQASLGLSKDLPINEDSNFLLSGGDSLKALVLCEDILTSAGLTSPELLEIILDGTFSDILHHIAKVKLVAPLEKNTHSMSEAQKRHSENSSPVPAKREHRESEEGATERFKVIKRAGEVLEIHSEKSTEDFLTVGDVGLNKNSSELKTASLQLSLRWSSDTGRCVDASPVVLVQHGARTAVFIGSHSHRMQALDVDSGSLIWERVLGDRIEASAAVSRCGTLVIVGCYDGCVYFLSVTSGETRWVFKTGDAVKCCPAVDPKTGLVIGGSHDGHVYALNPKAQQCVWKHHCGGGAVFSSPYLHPSHRLLFVASLGGCLICLNPDSGAVLWSYSKDAPFFSSPVGFGKHIVTGSADGNICCFSITGELLWQFLTKEPVFSSPCLTPDQQRVVCGSHDGHLYCLNFADGSLVWSFQTTGRVYSSPCVLDSSTLGTKRTLVGVASTDGVVWILDGDSGQKLASHTLPGELFSSPVIYKDSLIIGCRNDYVYCLQLSATKIT